MEGVTDAGNKAIRSREQRLLLHRGGDGGEMGSGRERETIEKW